MVGAGFSELTISAQAELLFDGERVARLTRGQHWLRPVLKLELPEWMDAGARARIERRLAAHMRDLFSHLLEPIAFVGKESAPLRGLSYQLEQGLGTVAKRQALPQLDALSELERAELAQNEIVVGKHTVYAAQLLSTDRLLIRAALCRAYVGLDPKIVLPSSERLYQRVPVALDGELALRHGFVVLRKAAEGSERSGGREACWAVRCDVLEALLAFSPEQALSEAMLLLGATQDEAKALLLALPRGRRRRRRRGA